VPTERANGGRSSLRTRRTVAILVDYLTGDYQNGLINAAEAAARERDGNLMIVVGRALDAPSPAEATQNEIYRRLGRECTDGVIIGSGCIGIYTGPAGLADFAKSLAPVPRCSVSAHVPGIPSFVVSNLRGQEIIVSHLIETHGCRRLAYIRGPLESDEAQERFDGYAAALAAHQLELDPALVESGNFWVDSGAGAMQRLLDRGATFDAVVVANDYMALGAMDVLRSRGVRVPHDVVVTGFDDIPSARITGPSLTTVRQPLQQLGRLAVENIWRQLDGQPTDDRCELDVELVTRQSCGCAYRVLQARSSLVPPGPPRDAEEELRVATETLRLTMQQRVRVPMEACGGWADRLLDALGREFRGTAGSFLLELEDVLDRAQPDSDAIDEFNTVVGVLRSHFRHALTDGQQIRDLDDLWHAAILLVGSAATRSQVRSRFDADLVQEVLRLSVERVSTALSHSALTEALRDVLPTIGLRSCGISLYEDDTRRELRPFFAAVDGAGNVQAGQPFAAGKLVPDGFFPDDRRWSYVVMPLSFATDHLGVALFEAGVANPVYTMLREQIGAALKGASLHRAIVQQTTLRERAEHEQIQKEMLIAQRIQTAILPARMDAPGLDLAATMLPAVEVGGDYYDVLPTDTDCWIGIGDVTGHGLLAGLEMLMIQSIVAGMVKTLPRAEPSELVVALNSVLFDSVRHRLGRDDHATLTLIKYRRDGSLTFAGNHEEILIWRARSESMERVPTPGFWTGAIPEVSHLTTDAHTKLDDGDLFVLYTDGVTEAMNHRHEQFGIERLCAVVEQYHAEPPRRICTAVVEAVRAWAESLNDDVSVLVGRYSAPSQDSPEPSPR
jgi:phosphoserine phosphatase RsbU/P